MLQRAITGVPGIIDEPLPQINQLDDILEQSPDQENQPRSYQQIQREDESVSHRSEAYLVSNMPDPIIPNRSRQLSEGEVP